MTTSVRFLNEGPGDVIVSQRASEGAAAAMKLFRLKPGQLSPAHADHVHSTSLFVVREATKEDDDLIK